MERNRMTKMDKESNSFDWTDIEWFLHLSLGKKANVK